MTERELIEVFATRAKIMKQINKINKRCGLIINAIKDAEHEAKRATKIYSHRGYPSIVTDVSLKDRKFKVTCRECFGDVYEHNDYIIDMKQFLDHGAISKIIASVPERIDELAQAETSRIAMMKKAESKKDKLEYDRLKQKFG